MNRFNRKMMLAWVDLGPRFLPFADAATPDLPLSRLLRLSLFQVSVGMALVLLIGTLNRVMIVELGVPASLVATMISLPLIFAPFRALIGFRSDTHHSALGWKRVPYIWKGTMLQFGGFAIMPFALLVLSGGGNASQWPVWVGWLGAGGAFLLVGAGMHVTQTVGLALATDLAPIESQPKVVGLMYVMLLVGMIASALLFGAMLADFTPLRLVRVIQGAAVTTMGLNMLALWKQETRRPVRGAQSAPPVTPTFRSAWASFSEGGSAVRRLVAVGLGTMAFSMEDILLEPYGGQVLHLTVGTTTKLTATLAIGGLLGFGLASRVLSRGAKPFRVAGFGALVGLPAFLAVIFSAPLLVPWLFALGTLLIGFGGGLFGHGTLTATMNLAPEDQRGLALGAWGAVQASAAGIAVALGGIIRDTVSAMGSQNGVNSIVSGPAAGYTLVYAIEVVLLLATLFAMGPLIRALREAHPDSADGSTVVNNGRYGSSQLSHAIVRIYDTAAKAAAAVKQLHFEGFTDDAITLIAGSETSPDKIMATLVAAWIVKSKAKVYIEEIFLVEEVRQQRWLLSVLAPFGMGTRAEEAMDRYGPLASPVDDKHPSLPQWDEAAPLSSALSIPVLYRSAAPSTSLGAPSLTSPHFSLSRALGLPLLLKSSSARLAPELSHFFLSSKLGLPLLLKGKGRRR
jgi:BCD family chlorophyll transporter-like MFS transporter